MCEIILGGLRQLERNRFITTFFATARSRTYRLSGSDNQEKSKQT